jgi:hypothetical protein
VCAGPLWPGGVLASSEAILLGVCGVSSYVSESGVGLFFICGVENGWMRILCVLRGCMGAWVYWVGCICVG